jgi:hypothetical protein
MFKHLLQSLAMVVLIAGCTPVHYVKIDTLGVARAKEQAAVKRVVLVNEFKDAREIEDPEAPRRIGRLGQGLFDSTQAYIEPHQGTELEKLVTAGFADVMRAAGHKVVTEGRSHLILDGEIRDFKINVRHNNMPIGPGIAIEGTFTAHFHIVAKDAATGKEVWKKNIRHSHRAEDVIIFVTDGKFLEFYENLLKEGLTGALDKGARIVAKADQPGGEAGAKPAAAKGKK